MNYIDFTQLEGLPLKQNTLKFLQDTWVATFTGLADFIGDNVIISGVADLGANYGDGWVIIDGEVLPFVGGVKADYVVIEETPAGKIFFDGIERDVWLTRVAKSGAVPGVAHADMVRLDTLKDIQAKNKYANIQFIIDGGGITITTGEKGHIDVGFKCKIIGWKVYGDAVGSIQIDIWKDSYDNHPPTVDDTITGADKPNLVAASKNRNLAVDDEVWSVDLERGDTLAYKVDSAATVKRVTVVLLVEKFA